MQRLKWRTLTLVALCLAASLARAAGPLTWEQVTERFERNNPSLLAQRTSVEETRADEITAGLRPNPQVSLTIDQWNFFRTEPFSPFANSQTIGSVSQMIERRNKRPLRVESARLATALSTGSGPIRSGHSRS
jgi:outer membrane protein, heavy metal efflux system